MGDPEKSLPPTSEQTLEYYPFQVKGYQGTFPKRKLLVLQTVDAREANNLNPTPLDSKPPVGVVTGLSENVIQKIYAAPLGPTLQSALARSAEEAGFIASAEAVSAYDPDSGRRADYVITSRIVRCWVKKHRGPNGRGGNPTWSTAGDFSIKVAVYKPPFKAPFWEATSSDTYYDPPIGAYGLGPEDEAGVYDQPGQVLSVALTRAVAGVFERQDFRELVSEDHVISR